jgi:hypothetical protein
LYSYTVPANAKYVAIHCVSNDQYIFCVDDITISGNVISGVAAVNLYDNGVLVASNITDGTYTANNLNAGQHCFSIRAVCSDNSESMAAHECVNVTSSGIDENSISVNLYPNPTNGSFMIECSEMTTVEVFNMVGQLVEKIDVNANSTSIDASSWAKGVYSIRIATADSNIVVKQLIKQ